MQTEADLCGTIHGAGGPCEPTDTKGCMLEMDHKGPHEFVDDSGKHWLWETDIECGCPHCMRFDGDYCTIYWPKPTRRAGRAAASRGGREG